MISAVVCLSICSIEIVYYEPMYDSENDCTFLKVANSPYEMWAASF